MSALLRSKPHFVIAYNGCDRKVGETALDSDAPDGIHASNQGHDWLGPGIYFWEADPVRAREWAEEAHSRQEEEHRQKRTPIRIRRPFVIGAIVNLGTCLDLTTREGVEIVREGYETYANDLVKNKIALPVNERSKDGRIKAKLDFEVLEYTCYLYGKQNPGRPIDTVRAFFPEGGEIYPGSQFQRKTHVQICVRKPSAILAYFRVHGMEFPP